MEEAQLVQHILLCCPEFEELRETMWEMRREKDQETLLVSAELAKRVAQFLINTRLLPQFPMQTYPQLRKTSPSLTPERQAENYLVTDSQAPNWELRILKNAAGITRLPPGASRVEHTFLSSRVRSRPGLTGTGTTRG